MAAVQFSESVQREIADIFTRYPTRQAATLPLLHIAQREFGHVSPEAEQLVADTLDLPVIAIENVVSFYTMYYRRPMGKHVVQVCHTLSCALCGAARLVRHLRERLGIDVGETSGDGMFSLLKTECLGACGTAPVVQINDRYYENLSVEKLDSVLEALRNGRAPDEDAGTAPR